MFPFSEQQIQEFQELYRVKCRQELSKEEAKKVANEIMAVYILLTNQHPIFSYLINYIELEDSP